MTFNNKYRKALITRGFSVSVKSCKLVICGCGGKNYSIAGNGIRRNNVFKEEVQEIINKYPIVDESKRNNK